jgi:transcription elongation factor GreA
MTKHPMTLRGAEKLREELRYRKSELRPQIIAGVEEARQHGDLKENAEYHAAREQHGFNEGRITEIEAKLSLAQVIDITTVPKTGKVMFGVTVELADVDSGDSLTYQIVGEDEADVKQQRISYASPIAKALIGKEEGDVAVVQTPSGKRELEIVSVQYLGA